MGTYSRTRVRLPPPPPALNPLFSTTCRRTASKDSEPPSNLATGSARSSDPLHSSRTNADTLSVAAEASQPRQDPPQARVQGHHGPQDEPDDPEAETASAPGGRERGVITGLTASALAGKQGKPESTGRRAKFRTGGRLTKLTMYWKYGNQKP